MSQAIRTLERRSSRKRKIEESVRDAMKLILQKRKEKEEEINKKLIETQNVENSTNE